MQQVSYFGHLLTADRVKADQAKVDAVVNMPNPENVLQMQSLIGMATYLTKFLPKLSEVCEPLRRLTRKDVEFIWTSEQEESVKRLKELATSTPVLKFYDVNEPVEIECDASSVGLGAVLMQNSQPVMYASKALSKSEQNYAQIEKECLAILHACTRFDQYVTGRKLIKVVTDHMPLVSIFKKPLLMAPKRIQRMLIKLKKYRIELNYKRGKEMHIADILSRRFPAEDDKNTPFEEEEVYELRQIKKIFKEIEQVSSISEIDIEDDMLNAIRTTTKADPEMIELREIVVVGWPEHRNAVNPKQRPYWNVRDEIVAANGFLFRGDRIIIPSTLRTQMIESLHYGHPGIVACIRRAKDTMYWPQMTEHIKSKIESCQACMEFSETQRKLPLQSTPIPDLPFQRVALDIMEMKNNTGNSKRFYLILCDYFSDWIEIDHVNNITSHAIIEACKKNFSRHGIPSIVVADQGSQFNSRQFKQFANDWGFKLSFSSPYHHQANGKAESAVKIIKRLIKKTTKSNDDIWLALLEWRNTINNTQSSPAQRLYSRRLRTRIPMKPNKLVPELQLDVKSKIKENRQKAKWYFDKKTRKLPELEIGNDVYVNLRPDNREQWKKATVNEKKSTRKYTVDVDGKQYERDRRYIRAFVNGEVQQPQQPPISVRSSSSSVPASSSSVPVSSSSVPVSSSTVPAASSLLRSLSSGASTRDAPTTTPPAKKMAERRQSNRQTKRPQFYGIRK